MIRSKLPEAPESRFAQRHYVLSDGSMAVLWAGRDTDACLTIITEAGESDPVSVPLANYPEIDRFPDGRWLVASTRAGANEANGLVLDKNGQLSHSIALGDGIEHVRCAQDGTIWVGYFDEGVYGDSIGSGGILQFDAHGHRLWSYNDRRQCGEPIIDDCYALTLRGDELWSCFYSDFFILRVKDGKETLWANSVVGAKALAVEGAFVLLAGGYGTDADRLALLKLDQGEAQLVGFCKCPEMEGAAHISGHSSVIHIVNNGTWSRITVAEARSKFS